MKPYYEHGGITIYHGDCRDIIPALPAVDLVLTDPPYGIAWKRGAGAHHAAHSGIQNDQDTSARDEALQLTATVPAIVFGSFYAPFPLNLKQVLVWRKPADSGVVGSTTGYRRDVEPVFLIGEWPVSTVKWSSLLTNARGISGITTATGHPHTKPLDLITALLRGAAANTVLDPFMGSGTTLVAAKNLGAGAIGIEIEERYCEVAAKRLGQEVMDFGA